MKRNTKDEIYNALLSHVNRKGIADISTLELAKELGISESVIFYHFKNVRNLVDECAVRYDRELMEKAVQCILDGKDMSQTWDVLMEYVLKEPNGANFYFDYVNYYGFDPTENNKRSDEFLKIAKILFKEKSGLDNHTILVLWDYITTQLFYYCNKMTKGFMEPNEENKALVKKIAFLVYDNI